MTVDDTDSSFLTIQETFAKVAMKLGPSRAF